MSSYGLTVLNNSQELTFSNDGVTYNYLGQATLVSVSQPTGDTSSGNAGYSTYTFNSSTDIVVALPIKTSGITALLSTSQSGSTWTITVYKGTNTQNAQGFDAQESTEVYVFGPPSTPSGYGLALYRNDGTLAANLSKRPLTWRGRLEMDASTGTWAYPSGLTTPSLIGSPQDYRLTSASAPPRFQVRQIGQGWILNTTSGNIERRNILFTFNLEDGAATPVNTIRAISAILIDAADYT